MKLAMLYQRHQHWPDIVFCSHEKNQPIEQDGRDQGAHHSHDPKLVRYVMSGHGSQVGSTYDTNISLSIKHGCDTA